MRNRLFVLTFALAAAGCVHAPEHAATTAQIDGDAHVVVRVEANRVWWSHCAWSEPHELWTLPSDGAVEDLHVTRSDAGFVVTFHQAGNEWHGTFDPEPTTRAPSTLARNP